MRRALVVVPTYCERDSLPAVLEQLLAAVPPVASDPAPSGRAPSGPAPDGPAPSGPQLDVLVVDDASPDGTGAVADRIAAAQPRVHVLHRVAKLGLGSAYLAGFAWALEREYDAVGEMDADLSHDPADLPRLLAALERADLVLGSRYVPGGGVRAWPLSRQLLSRGGNAYVRLLTGLPLADATAGFRMYRRALLEALPLEQVRAEGYAFQLDLALRTWRSGFRIVEIPITFTERTAGNSKMSRAIIAEALWRVVVWGLAGPRGPVAPAPASVAPRPQPTGR